jgi:hypothetical protein
MVCKADIRCILVRAECPYVQCSLLLVLLCAEVLLVGDTSWSKYKLVERGMAPKSLCVGVFECLSVCLEHCHSVVLSCPVALWLRVPLSFFIACKERGRVTVFRCKKMKR